MTGDAVRYDIHLEMGTDYASPSDNARTRVHLMPRDLPGRQIVTRRLINIAPIPSERCETPDFFGNITTALAFHRPIDRLDLTLDARVERLPPPPYLDLSPDLDGLASDIAKQKHLTAEAPHHYLGPSSRITWDAEIAAFARAQIAPHMTTAQVAVAVGQALHGEMRFDAEATDVDTPAAVAFANRHGVCQDFSHILIGGLRALGIPARYVSGFLRTIPPPGQPRLDGADAMHAWVSVWCGRETGWIEYDPTNACPVGLDHIAVAYGRDYGDVAPIKGVLRTSGEQDSYQRVDVIPVTG